MMRLMIRRSAPRLLSSSWQDQRGVAVTEFGLLAPVFLLLMLGSFDIGHTVYARSVLNGAVERAARAASLETGDTEEADAMVQEFVGPVMPGVELETKRTSYFDFADIGRPEKFTDGNGNNRCDNSEPYVDENGSGSWNSDIGVSNNGGAGDVVIYEVTARYSPLIPIPFMPEQWATREMVATAVKKNQPFANQQEYATTAGTCTD